MTYITNANHNIKLDRDELATADSRGDYKELIRFFARIWPETGRRCIVSLPGPRHYFLDTNEEAARKALELDAQPGVTGVFFACASQAPGGYKTRSYKTAEAFKAFWLDIDFHARAADGAEVPLSAEKVSAIVQALERMIVGLGLPYPEFVRSGGGVHVYWPLANPIPPAIWRPIALKLKAQCVEFGVDADPGPTADAARIMRVPFTHNRKRDKAGNVIRRYALVEWIPSPTQSMTIERARAAIGEEVIHKAAPVILQALDRLAELNLVDALMRISLGGIPKEKLATLPAGLRRNFGDPYSLWSNIGGAVRASYGDAAFGIFNAWSAGDPREGQYEGTEATFEKWTRLAYDRGLSVASVFALADALTKRPKADPFPRRELGSKPAWLAARGARNE